MGYYTSYTLSAVPPLPPSFDDAFEKQTSYSIDGLDDAKWYDHDDDMCALSLLYPDHYFTLYGDGEGSEDIWRAQYFRGKYHRVDAYLTYPDADMEALGNPQLTSPELFI